MLTDLDLAELQTYRSRQTPPDDFDEFWADTIATSRAAASPAEVRRIDAGLETVDVYDVTFSGWAGQPIRAWYRKPRGADGPLPTIVQYVGYGGGRGLPTENLLWSSAGFAHLYMDTRGQGSLWSVGDTPDPDGTGPQAPGVMTRGIADPATYYYRRLFTDAVRAVDIVAELPGADPDRVAAIGGSQGGGITLAVAGLVPGLTAVMADVPFLCDFPRALMLHDSDPYSEVVRYLAIHRDQVEQVTDSLRYFDGVNFSRLATAPARFTAALMDPTCKPSTVFGAFHAYAGEKEIQVYPFNAHEGGGSASDADGIPWLRKRFRSPTTPSR